MHTITYKTETSTSCIFSANGTIEEVKKKLAYIMEGFKYEITSVE